MITTILLYIVQNTVHAYIHYLALLTVCLIQFGADIHLFILFYFIRIQKLREQLTM